MLGISIKILESTQEASGFIKPVEMLEIEIVSDAEVVLKGIREDACHCL